MARIDNLEKLSDAWIEHCHVATTPHIPQSEDGDATFDTNLNATYIECCVPRCKWAASLRGDRVIETPRTTGYAPSRIPRDYQEWQ